MILLPCCGISHAVDYSACVHTEFVDLTTHTYARARAHTHTHTHTHQEEKESYVKLPQKRSDEV